MPTKNQPPSFLTTARAFYGPAFEHKKKKDIAASMAEWAEMDEDEQSFTAAHLAFLNLQAHAVTQRLLGQVRDLLEEVAESLSVALEASLPEPDEVEDEPEDELPELDEVLPAPAEPPSEGAEGGAE